MKAIILVIVALFCLTSKAADYGSNRTQIAYGGFRLLDVDEFSMSYEEFKHRRDPYAPEFDGRWKYRAALDFNFNILQGFYWKNKVHTEAIEAAVKTVGWEWYLGFRITPWLSVYQHHHSQHVMEEPRKGRNGRNPFPVEDSYGASIQIINIPGKKNSLLP